MRRAWLSGRPSSRTRFRPIGDPTRARWRAFSPLDHQRNFLTPDGVKVSFFAPEAGIGKLLSAYAGQPKPVVASVEDIFRMKAIACASRSKTRDWFDIYVLMREHGFSMGDFEKAFEDFGNPLAIDIALARMRSGKADLHDEGFAALRPGAPTVGEMAEFFRQASDAYARKKLQGPRSPCPGRK